MHEIPKHVDDITTHLVSDAIWEILRIVGALVISYTLIWFRKAGVRSSTSRAVGSLLAVAFLAFLARSAVQAHQRTGFFNGVVFASDCIVSFLLVLAIAYPLIRKLLPDRSKRLDWTKNRNLWTVEHSPEAAADIIVDPKGLHFRAQLKDKENRWAKMEIIFKEAQDYHAWAGISFDIRCERPYPDTYIRLEVKVPNVFNDWRGSIHRVEEPVSVFNGRAVFLFQEMGQPHWSLEKPCGYLNLRKIISVAVVCNTTCNDVEFFVNNFALMKFTEIPS